MWYTDLHAGKTLTYKKRKKKPFIHIKFSHHNKTISPLKKLSLGGVTHADKDDLDPAFLSHEITGVLCPA